MRTEIALLTVLSQSLGVGPAAAVDLLYHSPGAGYFSSLALSFLVCKVVMKVISARRAWKGLIQLITGKCLSQPETHIKCFTCEW